MLSSMRVLTGCAITILVILSAHVAIAARPMVASGAAHTLYLTENGQVIAAGSNSSGQLGDGCAHPCGGTSSGGVVQGLTDVVMVAAGHSHSMALKADGTVWTWGANDVGQLGLGTVDDNAHGTPTQVTAALDPGGTASVVAIAAGARHSLALFGTGGHVSAWGSNDRYQVHCSDPGHSYVPVYPYPTVVYSDCETSSSLTGIAQIAAGDTFSIALSVYGVVTAWGDNTYGQAGLPPSDYVINPHAVPSLSSIVRIAAGAYHALAIRPDGHAVAWGHNNVGQLGDGTLTDHYTPADVLLAPGGGPAAGAVLIAGGRQHSLIQYENGAVASFGGNTSGQLGRELNVAPGNCATSENDQCYAVEMSPHYTQAAGVFAGPMGDHSFIYIPGNGQFGRIDASGSNSAAELGLGFASGPVTTPAMAATHVGDKIGKRTNFRNDASPSDVLWRHNASGTNATWDFTGSLPATFTAAFPQTVGPDWMLFGTGDFNGDGRGDLLWYRYHQPTNTDEFVIWLMSDAGAIGSVRPSGWWSFCCYTFIGIGDLDGDGRADVLWRDWINGQLMVWYTGTNGQFSEWLLGPRVPWEMVDDWQVKGLADVNGDGIQDIVWLRPSDGAVAIWRNTVTRAVLPVFPGAVGPASPWTIAATGDFDGDGRDDIFWRNKSDGTNAVWYMKGGGAIDGADFFVGAPVAQWRLDVTGDYNGDGRDDLMWYDITNGNTTRWSMTGRGVAPVFETLIGIGPGWHAVQ